MPNPLEVLETDVLIVGGGAAGCAAAVEAREAQPGTRVLVVEKAHVSRSGCLAMGLNAINAYLPEGRTPEEYLEGVRTDAHGILREDLVLTLAQEVNAATHRVESWGLPIPRDSTGKPYSKGPNSIRILGESLKPLLASRLRHSGAVVINRHTLLDLWTVDGRVAGALFLGVRTGKLLAVRAHAVVLATGGASGLYRTQNRGDALNRMWYSPFNAGSGYAAALRAGAELTTLEMRFIPTRIRHTAAPTGTLAQTFGAREENVLGEAFNRSWAARWEADRLTTPLRLRALIEEMKAGRGPVGLRLGKLPGGALEEVLGAYLDMTPAQVALWAGEGLDPEAPVVTIATSGPYVLGGHTGSGLWVDEGRRSTVAGLYAAGDVAGGAPKKYVSGAWVEGFRAARSALADLASGALPEPPPLDESRALAAGAEILRALTHPGRLAPAEAAERLQSLMDEYAGGISTFYELHGRRLELAARELAGLEEDLADLGVTDLHGLLLATELRDRLLTARALVAHLAARQETRWPGYQTRVDYPDPDERWACFVNSRLEGDAVHVFTRPLHQDGPRS